VKPVTIKFTSPHRPMTGERSPVRRFTPFCVNCVSDAFLTETMIEHRARTLFSLLPIALATGYSEIEPDLEPLKVLMVHLSRLWA
jgi:hypothetical protein